MINIKRLQLVFLIFATVGFFSAVAPLTFDLTSLFSEDILETINTRATVSSAIATSIAILLAIFATFLLVKVESADFKAVEKAKTDVIELANCLKLLYRAQAHGALPNDLKVVCKEQIIRFLISTSAFSFDCWITNEKNKRNKQLEWGVFFNELIFILSDLKEKAKETNNETLNCSLQLYGVIELLESLRKEDIQEIVKYLENTGAAMAAFKETNLMTPLHKATALLERVKLTYFKDIDELIQGFDLVTGKEKSFNQELLLAFYDENKVWISDKLSKKVGVDDEVELKDLKEEDLRKVERKVLNNIATELYMQLMGSPDKDIKQTVFFDIFTREKSKDEYYETVHGYLRAFFQEGDWQDYSDNPGVCKMEGLLIQLYLDALLDTSISCFKAADIKETLTNFCNLDGDESIKKRYIALSFTSDFEKIKIPDALISLIKNLTRRQGLINNTKNKAEIVDVIQCAGIDVDIEELVPKSGSIMELPTLDEKIELLRLLDCKFGYSNKVCLESFIYERAREHESYCEMSKFDEYGELDDMRKAELKKFPSLLKFNVKEM